MKTRELKIYQDTVELCKVLHRLVRNFPRFEKYSIGSKLFNDSLELIRCISHANRSFDNREQWFTEYLTRFEVIQALLRISVDEHFISINLLKAVTEKVVEIERQVTYLKNRAPKSRKQPRSPELS